MAVPIEEAIAALSTFSLEDDQPDIQGMTVLLSSERCGATSPIDYSDIAAYRLSLLEDAKAVNQLAALVKEGRDMSSILYSYRSCVKALPQLPDSMKQYQADLYLETYQLLDIEMNRLRDVQKWQALAASRLAADMDRFSRPERSIKGPTVTHLWLMLKLLDILMELDHLKNAKSSIPNDFSWYKRTFTQVSVHWSDTDSLREELDDLQIFLSTRWAIMMNLHVEISRVNNVENLLQILVAFCVETLERDPMLLFSERHLLLRVLPILVVFTILSEKDNGSLYKRVKIDKLIAIFKHNPVVPALPDLHFSPAAVMKELAGCFPKFANQSRLLSLFSPHEIPQRESLEHQKRYLIFDHIEDIRAEHDDFAVRFASAVNQITALKSSNSSEAKCREEGKRYAYDIVVEGFQLLSLWTGHVWEQCAWKFSHPCKDSTSADANETSDAFSDYQKVVRWNYTADEREVLVEVISYIKNIGSMMHHRDSLLVEVLREVVHGEVQDFVQNKLAMMMQTTFRKKKELFRILSDMRTISADWMANMTKPYQELDSRSPESVEVNLNTYPRSVGPTATQVHCLQFLIFELLSGGGLTKEALFETDDSEVYAVDVKQLEIFFYKLKLFPCVLDYTGTIDTLTDLGFLWFREFFLDSSRVIQFPVECSIPWILVDHVLESDDGGLLESVLIPFDVYNDSAQYALSVLKQRFLYDEIEAEADLCFDQFVMRLSERIFSYSRDYAASVLLDSSFLSALENADRYRIHPVRLSGILNMQRVKLLGRSINLKAILSERINMLFRANIDFLLDQFDTLDICAIIGLYQLLDVLKSAHKMLSANITLDCYQLIWSEMRESTSLVSFSSRLALQIWAMMQDDFLSHFILCKTTERFIRLERPHHHDPKLSIHHQRLDFNFGLQELNNAYHSLAQLYHGFFGAPHMLAIYNLLGCKSMPWLVRALLDHISVKIAALAPKVAGLQEVLPKSFALLPVDANFMSCRKFVEEQLDWSLKMELRMEFMRDLKEIGSILYLFILLDNVVKEVETTRYMQISPWLGHAPGDADELQRDCPNKDSPLIDLFQFAAVAVGSGLQDPPESLLLMMSKQVEAADILCRKSLHSGSLLEYALAFVNAALDRYRSKWSPAPKTGFVDIMTSKDFYRVYSAIQLGYLLEVSRGSNNIELLGDSVAWGGCTIAYLLGQEQQFQLFDFSNQLLKVAEADTLPEYSKVAGRSQDNLLDAMEKARRMNIHVFSVLRARCPLEDKVACGIKQSGIPLNRVQYQNTPSIFETLPQRGL